VRFEQNQPGKPESPAFLVHQELPEQVETLISFAEALRALKSFEHSGDGEEDIIRVLEISGQHDLVERIRSKTFDALFTVEIVEMRIEKAEDASPSAFPLQEVWYKVLLPFSLLTLRDIALRLEASIEWNGQH
jgi:hypothetical protein